MALTYNPDKLAIKYRPLAFADVRGQNVVLPLLIAQILDGRLGDAYLFSGPPGTGKTTLARIVARRANCERAEEADVEPCGKCRSCRLSLSDAHRDIIELDCAQHGGVDDVRELSRMAAQMPEAGGFRVFILDECHLLTPQAQAALLKLMEQPPPHVKFFLCTTDAQRLGRALQTRCQGFVLQRVPQTAILQLLTEVVKLESVRAQSEALSLIAEAADGSMRDALTILDMVRSVEVTEDVARAVVGRGPRALAVRLLFSVVNRNRKEAFGLTDAAVKEGHSLSALCEEMARGLMAVYREKVDRVQDGDPLLAGIKETLSAPKLLTILAGELLKISTRIRQNGSPDLTFQVGLLDLIEQFASVKAQVEAAQQRAAQPQ